MSDHLKAIIDNVKLNQNSVSYGSKGIIQLSSSSSSSQEWYYNININEPLPKKPIYVKYYSFGSIWTGDILYEDAGFGGLTGHIGIMEGEFYDSG